MILFDEIEKAHQDVFNILLQILEDGRLTDGHGRTVDFKNTVVIMTSNLGTAVLQDTHLPESERRRIVLETMRAHFRPEFLNRIDEIIIFNPLTREQIKAVVDIQLSRLRQRLGARKITLSLTPAAKDLLATEGYDPTYGARPLKRVIQRRLEDPLSLQILEGKFHEGDSLEVDAQDGQLVIQKATKAEPVAAARS